MTPINNIIKRELNPFDLINLKPGNFWGEEQDSDNSVESIHQEVINEVEGFLDLVNKDNRSRTVLLLGDSGSGKSYLLGRLKRTLNKTVFFAYIGPWADSDYIWRHVLRSTVDSLIQVPEEREESQLILWLKSLSAFTRRNLKQRLFSDSIWQFMQSDRRKFIHHLKTTYSQAGLYNPDFFFGVLHDLTDPELYPIACEWLRGDDLSEESMQMLKVKNCIDTEEAAKNILANFGRISIQTQPIVLCFDNLDNIPRSPIDGFQDFQSLFNINTTIHNNHLKNFLVIVSVITNTWKLNSDRIQQADKARIDKGLRLKPINLEQAEALWAYRLKPLHEQVTPQPVSPIFPLNRKLLQQSFPSHRTLPRNTLVLGRKEYQNYKFSLIDSKIVKPIPESQ
ncbi:MAG: ATP-binding protein, partial [Cyanobacteria bacterium J06649_11]